MFKPLAWLFNVTKNKMPAARIAVLVSGRGSNLQCLLDGINAGQLAARVVGVFSDQPKAAALSRVAKPLRWAQSPQQFAGRAAFDEALAEAVAACKPDWVICAGYMRILGTDFVNRFSGQLVNIHPSLLPRYKGLNTHSRVLVNGDRWHGASVHFVVPELDSGAVIAQARVRVKPEDNAHTLAARVLIVEHRLLLTSVQLLISGRICEREGSVWLDGQRLSRPLYLNAERKLTV